MIAEVFSIVVSQVYFSVFIKMSGAYTLFHVFNELLDDKATINSTARGKTMGAKSEIYQNSWSALNAWMETKLAKQKVLAATSLI